MYIFAKTEQKKWNVNFFRLLIQTFHKSFRDSGIEIPASSARLIFYRPEANFDHGTNAQIFVDGVKVGECPNKGFFYSDVKPGVRKIRLEMFAHPGIYEISEELQPGKEIFIEITMRDSAEASLFFGGVSGGLLESASNDSTKSAPWQLKVTDKFMAELELVETEE